LYVVVGKSHVLESERGGTAGVGQGRGPEDGPGAGLRAAVGRLRRELTAHRPLLPDRAVAQDELAALAGQADNADRALGLLDPERMRHSLLLVAAALGSVSALTEPLDALRQAVEQLAPPRPQDLANL
jgi:hypothetical protein